MKFTCLSGNPNFPCNFIKFKSTLIMLDCSLDQTSLLSFLPMPLVHSNHFNSLPSWNGHKELSESLDNEIKECCDKIFVDSAPEFCLPEFSCINPRHIDVILISNYRSMLALPFITERTSFSGFVYATEPTLNLGRLFMEELVTYIERNPKLRQATAWKTPHIFNKLPFTYFPDSISPESLSTIYTIEEINSCLSKVKPVAFSEKINIFGSLHWYPVSSGHSIGSSNWVIESAHEKIVYISSSSTLTTHPRHIDTAPFKNADVLIMTSLSLTPGMNPNLHLNDFCQHIEKNLKNGGNVLVPCYPSGMIYDLFECLSLHMESTGVGSVPIYFISTIAEHSLAYSNIMAEWLSEEKQNRIYIPEEPFPHAHYVKNGRIKYFSSLSEDGFNNEFRMPCVVFTGHPSLRFGDVVHFIELWGSSPNNMILLTEPEFPYIEALAPYQPLAMKVIYCPIDTRLAFTQANKIIRDISPTNLVLPHQYTVPFNMVGGGGNNNKPKHETMIESDNGKLFPFKMFPFKRKDSLKLPIKCQYERIYVDPELASQIKPVQIDQGLSLATVTGILETKDNKFRLSPITKSYQLELVSQTPTKTLPPNHYLFGNVDINRFVTLLEQAGMDDAQVICSGPNRFTITLRSKGIVVEVGENSTVINTEQWNNEHRLMIRDLLTRCLHRI